jgi:hypothetical protein
MLQAGHVYDAHTSNSANQGAMAAVTSTCDGGRQHTRGYGGWRGTQAGAEARARWWRKWDAMEEERRWSRDQHVGRQKRNRVQTGLQHRDAPLPAVSRWERCSYSRASCLAVSDPLAPPASLHLRGDSSSEHTIPYHHGHATLGPLSSAYLTRAALECFCYRWTWSLGPRQTARQYYSHCIARRHSLAPRFHLRTRCSFIHR